MRAAARRSSMYVLSAGCLLVACSQGESTRSKLPSPGGTTERNVGEEVAEDDSDVGKQLAGLLKDVPGYDLADLDSEVPCTPITGLGDAAVGAVIEWPKSLKNFMVSYLKRAPIVDQFVASIEGFYLVKSGTLEADVGGITCFQSSDKRGVIFINEALAVDMREAAGVGRYQKSEGVIEKFVYVNMRDDAAATIVHEAMHAVDFKLFLYGTDTQVAVREALLELSWTDYDHPKDADRISVYALGDESRRGLSLADAWKRFRCKGGARGGFGLTAASGEALAKEFKYLAEETNFIVPYTMANAIEDFAETLTVYLFLTRDDAYDIRRVYDQDLTKVPVQEATMLYDHDVKNILATQPAQKGKMCELAEKVFGEACKL